MRKLKVLIADDIESIVKKNKEIVEKNENIEVVGLAYNGKEEYDMILELKPDIVISDNQMPKMNGIEVVQKILNSDLAYPPKFILVTADAGFDFNMKCFGMGISSVISKDNIEYELGNALKEIVDEIKFEAEETEDYSMIEYNKWYEKFSTIEKIDLNKYFTKEDFKILRKLGIKIKNKIYTELEFELLEMEFASYYYEDSMTDVEKTYATSLDGTGVTREEYNELIKKFDKI